MNSKEINILLSLVETSVDEVANEIKENRVQVSQVIHFKRSNPRIRKKVSAHIAQRVADRMFAETSTLTTDKLTTERKPRERSNRRNSSGVDKPALT